MGFSYEPTPLAEFRRANDFVNYDADTVYCGKCNVLMIRPVSVDEQKRVMVEHMTWCPKRQEVSDDKAAAG